MPEIFCNKPPSLCTDPSVPTANFSSEAPDQEVFFGRGYSSEQPPLGSPWRASSCVGTCESNVSQAEANACAQRANIDCLSREWPVFNPNPNPDQPNDPFIPVQRGTFLNDEQSCDFTCPDGQVFTFTIPAGTVSAFSQAAADASALSMACNGAIDSRICIGELEPTSLCAGDDFSATVNVSSPKLLLPGNQLVVTIISGVLPAGLQLDTNASSFTISGNTLSPGQYDFTVRADVIEDGFVGSFMDKTFTLNVVEIAQDTLADGKVGNVYSEQLSMVGPTFGTVTWAVVSGSLPSGLSMSDTGLISGTATTEEDATFSVSATDDLVTCTKEFTISIGPGVEYQDLVWSLQLEEELGTGVATWISPGAGGTGSTWEAETSATIAGGTNRGRLTIRATMVYAGAPMAGQVQITVSNNNEVDAQPGINSSSISYFINAAFQVGASMPNPPPFNGVYTLDFTASAGTLLFVIDLFTSGPGGTQPSPMTIHVSGVILNL